MDELTIKFEVKTSRNDLPIPVINGIHLHSIYNPIKEAEAFVDKHQEVLKHNNNFLILGLGFGYHIEEIIRTSQNKINQIIVIEPNQELVQSYFQNRTLPKNVEIKCYQDVESYFYDYHFIQFLIQRPSIIKHDTSFNLERNFYTKLLSFHCPENIDSYYSILSKTWKEYFKEVSQNISLTTFTDNIKKQPSISNKNDYLLLCLAEIKKNKLSLNKEL